MTAVEKLITNFSDQHLKDFFFNKIHSFEPDTDVFHNILKEESQFDHPIKIGQAELENSDELLVFVCKSYRELTARSAKKKQYEIAKQVLKE
ncbi:MAG TPA: hypothetical protein VK021_11300, partial [Flavobacteriaceae bacterium]|nr:hypothetical protein [Flavobacteriaceae bacterium]